MFHILLSFDNGPVWIGIFEKTYENSL